mgnify:CR=1 FL=1
MTTLSRKLEDAGYVTMKKSFAGRTPLTEYKITAAGRKALAALRQTYAFDSAVTYQRTGTLWEGRYKSTLVDADNYVLTVYRYIELNPVRAAMVERPEDFRTQEKALGEPRFQAMVEKALNRTVALRPRGRPRAELPARGAGG